MSKNSQDWPCVDCSGRIMTHVAEPYYDKSGVGTWATALGVKAYRRVKKCIRAGDHHDYLPISTYEIHEADLRRIEAELTQLRAMREEIGRIIAAAGDCPRASSQSAATVAGP